MRPGGKHVRAVAVERPDRLGVRQHDQRRLEPEEAHAERVAEAAAAGLQERDRAQQPPQRLQDRRLGRARRGGQWARCKPTVTDATASDATASDATASDATASDPPLSQGACLGLRLRSRHPALSRRRAHSAALTGRRACSPPRPHQPALGALPLHARQGDLTDQIQTRLEVDHPVITHAYAHAHTVSLLHSLDSSRSDSPGPPVAANEAPEPVQIVRTRLLRQGKAGVSGGRTEVPVGRPQRSSREWSPRRSLVRGSGSASGALRPLLRC